MLFSTQEYHKGKLNIKDYHDQPFIPLLKVHWYKQHLTLNFT